MPRAGTLSTALTLAARTHVIPDSNAPAPSLTERCLPAIAGTAAASIPEVKTTLDRLEMTSNLAVTPKTPQALIYIDKEILKVPEGFGSKISSSLTRTELDAAFGSRFNNFLNLNARSCSVFEKEQARSNAEREVEPEAVVAIISRLMLMGTD
ncbi:hypothetical protein B0H19DRAFT_1069631 [Mycena capillaripes]|nr:hypothetical protein B0H19DRAFT_1069631 [Mycena capillaripes]